MVIDQEDDREGDGQRTSPTGPVYKSTWQSGSWKTGTDGITLCSPTTLLEDGARRPSWHTSVKSITVHRLAYHKLTWGFCNTTVQVEPLSGRGSYPPATFLFNGSTCQNWWTSIIWRACIIKEWMKVFSSLRSDPFGLGIWMTNKKTFSPLVDISLCQTEYLYFKQYEHAYSGPVGRVIMPNCITLLSSSSMWWMGVLKI